MKKYVYIILLLMLFNGCREAVPDQYVRYDDHHPG